MTDFTKANDAEAARHNSQSRQRDALSDNLNSEADSMSEGEVQAMLGDSSDDEADEASEQDEQDDKWTDRFKPENLPGN